MQPNTALFTTGWSNSMMDEPEWGSGTRINIQKMDVGGSVKWDTRSSGRYLALNLNFTYTEKMTMTGADIDIQPTAGR